MKIVGLTGGIGSGKTTIAKIFSHLGYPVYNSDTEAKNLINTNAELISEIKHYFGDDLYNNKGLNREKMASIVFNNPDKLKQLNSIVHPAVQNDFELWCNKQKSDLVIKEAAILFESGAYKSCDLVVAVIADINTRLKRVIKRDNTTQKAVINRMKNQFDTNKLIELSDYCINNNDNSLILEQIFSVISDIRSI